MKLLGFEVKMPTFDELFDYRPYVTPLPGAHRAVPFEVEDTRNREKPENPDVVELKRSHKTAIRSTETDEETGSTAFVLHLGDLPAHLELTEKERKLVKQHRLDVVKAEKLKPFWAAGKGYKTAAFEINKRGFGERTCADYWSKVFNALP